MLLTYQKSNFFLIPFFIYLFIFGAFLGGLGGSDFMLPVFSFALFVCITSAFNISHFMEALLKYEQVASIIVCD